MWREEVIGDARLILADCLEVVPTLSGVDAVVTDPPYGARYKSEPNSKNSISSTGKRFSVPIIGDDVDFDPNPFLIAPDVLFTGAQYFYDRLPAGGSLHVWDKRGDYRPLDQADADIVWHNRPGVSRSLYCLWRGLCRHVEHDQPIEHPSQKPVVLMTWLIERTDAATILDPFMGS